MTILELFKKVHPSVLAAKMIFKHLQNIYPVLKISDIADTSSGGTPSRGMIEYYNGDIPWVKSGELKDGLITTCDEYITESGLKNSSAKLFPKGTLLVAMYGANIGKTGVLDFDATTNQAICAIFPKVDISKEFLFWYFKQQRIDFIAIGKGGAQPNISQTVINNASIVVPDKKTQKKIVDFLERIEKGEGIDEKFFIPEVLKDVEQIYKYKNSYVCLSDSFENQLTQIENLNQAILQEAVQGKLLSESELAELKNEPNYETGKQLLKKIKAEKQKSGKKEKPLLPIKPEEIPFNTPEDWVWCRLGEIALQSEAGKSFRCEEIPIVSNEWGVIKVSAVSWDNFLENQNKLYSKTEPLDIKAKIKVGDFLISRANTSELVGKSVVVKSISKNLLLSDKTIRFEFSKSVSTDYVNKCNNSIYARKYYSVMGTGTSPSMKNITREHMTNLLIPLPPLSEQKLIAAEIEKRLSKTKQLKEHIIANQQATEQLLKALLHGAFEVEEVKEI